jgi:hypothetical protein
VEQDFSKKLGWSYTPFVSTYSAYASALNPANVPLSLANQSNNLQPPDVNIVCTKCYVNALATAELKVGSGGNVSQAIEEAVDAAGDLLKNVGRAAADWFQAFVGTTVKDIFTIDAAPITFPPFNVSLDVPVESNSSVSLDFGFEELELFLQIRTMLAADSTYTIPLFSTSRIDGPFVDINFGVFFTVDLILDVDRPLDMTSGIHLKLDNGVLISIDLFGDKPSDIIV